MPGDFESNAPEFRESHPATRWQRRKAGMLKKPVQPWAGAVNRPTRPPTTPPAVSAMRPRRPPVFTTDDAAEALMRKS